jgi:effector-binding domain-containing protein
MTADQSTEPSIVTRAEQPYVGITRQITMTTFYEVADRLPEIFEWLGVRGVEPAGAPFFRYYVIDMENMLEVEAGVPVPAGSAVPASDEDVTAGVLPAGRYASVSHVGHPDQLVRVTAELLVWAEKQGLRWDSAPSERGDTWGSRLEFHKTNPAVEPDMNKWETELCIRLAD